MSELFKASRFTSGNCFFPTAIEVTDDAIRRRKRTLFSADETSMHLSKVASVHVKTGVLFSDVRIESSGGGDDIVSHGHTKADALRIKAMIEAAQSRLAKGGERG